jgi:FAD/FMN-containing dehydrogenase
MGIDAAALHTLTSRLIGEVVTAEDASFDEVRRVWNGAIDRRPAVIARCRCPEDVGRSLDFARENGLPVVVRGGGHSFAGLSTCDDGVVIDLSLMKEVTVDVPRRRAVAQAGVLGGELDRATQRHGLGTTLGTVSHTGVAGLTLGGGMGWLMRLHGLACDNLLSVEAVLADGSIVRANENQHSDLFWALRGGGAGFAAVTEFEYELHPFGPGIALAQFMFDPRDGRAALRLARDLARDAPRERDLFLGYLPLPADNPNLPPELRGQCVFLVLGFSADLADADGAWLAPLRELNPWLADVRVFDYNDLQSLFDKANRHGVQAYGKGAFVADLSDDALEVFVEQAQRGRGEVLAYLQQTGGKVAEVAGTAVQGRSADYVLNVIARWSDPADAAGARTWAREFAQAMKPHGLTTAPLNFDGDPAGDTIYGHAVARLQEIKGRYDPDGVFGPLRL